MKKPPDCVRGAGLRNRKRIIAPTAGIIPCGSLELTRALTHREQLAERGGHRQPHGVRLAPQGVQYLIQLIAGGQGQIQKEDFPAAKLADAARVAVQPVLTHLPAQTRGQIEGLRQKLYRVHPCSFLPPVAVQSGG